MANDLFELAKFKYYYQAIFISGLLFILSSTFIDNIKFMKFGLLTFFYGSLLWIIYGSTGLEVEYGHDSIFFKKANLIVNLFTIIEFILFFLYVGISLKILL